jgi:hypothetical protein
MRAPASKRSRDEIIKDIIRYMKCPPEVAPFVEPITKRLINDLCAASGPFSGNRKENTLDATELRDQIAKLERKLKRLSGSFLLSILFEERFWQVWAAASGGLMEINANTRAYIAQERTRQNRFIEELGRLRAQCDELIKRRPGEHGSVKYERKLAAKASFVVLEGAASHTGTKLRLGRSRTSKFVKVASLFLEAATGEYNTDLRWACGEVLAELRAKGYW